MSTEATPEREDELAIRQIHGNFFVKICSQWVERVHVGNEDEYVVSQIGQSFVTEADEIAGAIAVIQGCQDQMQRLIATENLADLLEQMLQVRRLRTRSSTIDALEDFWHMGELQRVRCSICNQRYGAFTEGDEQLCAHCLAAGSGN